MTEFILYLGLSFLFIHEMDAIYRKEWRLFIFLNNLADNKAYRIFTFLHLPLYLFLFWALFMANENFKHVFTIILNAFYIFHLLLHILFLKNPKNEFKGFFTWFLLVCLAITGLFYLILILF